MDGGTVKKQNPFLREGVDDSPDLRRILSLPWYDPSPEEIEAIVSTMTEMLRRDAGTMRLRPQQALALASAAEQNGLVGFIRTGGGKTALSALLGRVMNAKKVLLILPAKLKAKTYDDFDALRPHFGIPNNIRIESYSKLGTATAKTLIKTHAPDLIILDEAHKAKNRKAAVTRVLERYVREHPECRVVVMSGSFQKDSLRDYAHLVRWALGRGAPVPEGKGELEEWACALDAKLAMGMSRRAPGALLRLARPEDKTEPDQFGNEPSETTIARRGFRRRLIQTAGVVATADAKLECKLHIRAIEYDVGQITEDNFQKLRSQWLTPTDDALMLAPQVWKVANELALGMHYIWDPPAPPEWKLARKSWASYVRTVLKESRTLDSEFQVKDAIRKKNLAGAELGEMILKAWEKVAPTFVPNVKPVWHDDTALDICVQWMKERPGVVWTKHTFFAKELARRTGASYFGAQGLDKTGRAIEKATPATDPKGIIASVPANGEGRNLQVWNRGLHTCPTGSPIEWEQLLARFHRDGTQYDHVHYDVLVGCMEHIQGWYTAIEGANAILESQGGEQKILIADAEGFPDMDDVEERTDWRWGKQAEANRVDDILAEFGKLL